MVKAVTLDKNTIKKGAWSEEEDSKLRVYIQRYGHWNWGLLPKFAGLSRSGKSCRLRWMNYLRPNIKHGNFTKEDDDIIVSLHKKLGNKWTAIAAQLPGRSDNEVKNRWNSHLKKQIDQDDDQTVLENNHHETTKPDQAPSCSDLSCSDYAVSSDDHVTPQTYDYELSGDFWSELPLLVENNTTFSDDKLIEKMMMTPLSVVDDFVSHQSDMIMMSDEDFSWSTLVSYFEYNN